MPVRYLQDLRVLPAVLDLMSTYHDADKPLIPSAGAVGFTSSIVFADAEFDREGQVGTVGSRLIPSLDGCCNRAQYDCTVQNLWMFPAVLNFMTKFGSVVLVQLLQSLEQSRALSSNGTFAKLGKYLLKLICGGEVLDLLHQLVARNIDQWVADSAMLSTSRQSLSVLV